MVNTFIMLLALVPATQPQQDTLNPEVVSKEESPPYGPFSAKKGMSMEDVVWMDPGVLYSYDKDSMTFLSVYSDLLFYVRYQFDHKGLRLVAYTSQDVTIAKPAHFSMYKELVSSTKDLVGKEADSSGMKPILWSIGHNVETKGLEEAVMDSNHWTIWNTEKGPLVVYFKQGGLYTAIQIIFTPT